MHSAHAVQDAECNNEESFSVFSLILSITGKINFQTGKAILLPVEFSRIPSNFKQ